MYTVCLPLFLDVSWGFHHFSPITSDYQEVLPPHYSTEQNFAFPQIHHIVRNKTNKVSAFLALISFKCLSNTTVNMWLGNLISSVETPVGVSMEHC